MPFIVTEQYIRGEEKVIAEFHHRNDGIIFINYKCKNNEIERKKCIYRLYDDNFELLHEFNHENLSISRAKYRDGYYDFDRSNLLFIVIVNPKKILAQFTTKNDARLFVIGKCSSEKTIQGNDLFYLYHGLVLQETLSKNIIADKQIIANHAQDQQSRFSPSPLSTRPLPPGVAPDCWHENQEHTDK